MRLLRAVWPAAARLETETRRARHGRRLERRGERRSLFHVTGCESARSGSEYWGPTTAKGQDALVGLLDRRIEASDDWIVTSQVRRLSRFRFQISALEPSCRLKHRHRPQRPSLAKNVDMATSRTMLCTSHLHPAAAYPISPIDPLGITPQDRESENSCICTCLSYIYGVIPQSDR